MEDYAVKMEAARDEWTEFSLEIQNQVDRHFSNAKDRGFEMPDEEYQWRRVGVARALTMAKEDEDDIDGVTKAGIRNLPKFMDGGDWRSYLHDFDELMSPTRPAYMRIRILRQVMGAEAKRQLDAYLMPAVLYSDYDEYVKDATPILEPRGGDRQAYREVIRC